MQPSRRRAPAKPAGVLRWSPPKSRSSPTRPRKPPKSAPARATAPNPVCLLRGTPAQCTRCDGWEPHQRETIMPRGDKSSYTDKQKRKAEHIEEGYEERGVGKSEAERRAWATVNKETGGGKKSGSGRGVPTSNVSSKRGAGIDRPPGRQ